MQIPILNGIYADSTPELRTSYPVNMVPVTASWPTAQAQAQTVAVSIGRASAIESWAPS
jgi:hypothetical protein